MYIMRCILYVRNVVEAAVARQVGWVYIVVYYVYIIRCTLYVRNVVEAAVARQVGWAWVVYCRGAFG
jgi:uncharacterized membrane protein